MFLQILPLWEYIFHEWFRFPEVSGVSIFLDIDAELVVDFNHIVNGDWGFISVVLECSCHDKNPVFLLTNEFSTIWTSPEANEVAC
jgi:hypothetical protein